jgi:ABC-type nitrate/sulfonate/bicarbonate transport system substrate-binding protein
VTHRFPTITTTIDEENHVLRKSSNHSRLKRRPCTTAAALAATSAMLLAACGGGSGDSADDGARSIKIGYYSGALVSLPALVAEEKGFFADNGLDATLVKVPNGPAMTSGLASGSLDFVNNSYDNLAVAAEKKLPVKAVVGNTVRVPFKLLVRDGVEIPHADEGYPGSIQDLVGLTWGVIALGVSVQYMDEALLTGAGEQADDVTFLAVGLGDSARAALNNGTVDTYLATEPLPAIADATGEASVAVDLAAGEGPPELADLDYNGWWASDKAVSSDSDTVERFVKANEDAYCWYSDPSNFDELLSLMQKAVPVPALDDDQYASMLKSSLDTFGVTIRDESLKTWQDLLMDNGQLESARERSDLAAEVAPSNFSCS